MVKPLLILPSGVSLVDRVLNGGLHTGLFIHVFGKAASGKTTLALQFVNAACRLGHRTIYVNSENTSPIERLEQITCKDFSEVQNLVKLFGPRSFSEQGALIDDLELYAQEGTILVVVDTLTKLYRLVLEDKKTSYEAHRELNTQAGSLKGLARQKDMIVLVLNQVRGSFETAAGFEPVAKNILDYWSDYEIRMHIGKRVGERMLERTRPEGEYSKSTVYLTSSGLSSDNDMKETVK